MENSACVAEEVMLRQHLYSDMNERSRHFGEIQCLGDELRRPVPEIAQRYEELLEYLRASAQVTDYLPVLVSKKVREIFRPPGWPGQHADQ